VVAVVTRGTLLDVTFGRWDGPIQTGFHVDSLSHAFALMSLDRRGRPAYLHRYMKSEKGRPALLADAPVYCRMINWFIPPIYFLLYFSWEFIGLCSFFLVGFCTVRRRRPMAPARC